MKSADARQNLTKTLREPPGNQSVPGSTKVALALVSGSMLTLEISMTRFFSILFVHHYTYLVLSIAVFGLAAGGIFAKLVSDRNKKVTADHLPWIYPAMASVSVLIMTAVLSWIPVAQNLAIAAVFSIIPFFMVGVFIATVFQRYPESSRTIYGFDLLGATTGSGMALLLLRYGAINTQLYVSFALAAAVFTLTHGKGRNRIVARGTLVLSLSILGLLVTNSSFYYLGSVPFAEKSDKTLDGFLQNEELGAKIEESRRSAFGRTDYVTSPVASGITGFYIDGVSGTPMYPFDGNFAKLRNTELDLFPLHLPLTIAAGNGMDHVLVIGAGGGRDVLLSLMYGAKKVTAVEVNRDIVDLMRKYGDINGGLYSGYPGVEVVVAEGRNYLKSVDDFYDAIVLTMPVIQTSRSIEGYALTENFLLTIEAVSEYYDRLSPDGQIVIIGHNELEIFRLVSTAIEMFQRKGVSPAPAMQYMYAFGMPLMPAFVLKKSPVTQAEAELLDIGVHQNNWISPPLFIPHIPQTTYSARTDRGLVDVPVMNPTLYKISTGQVSADYLVERRTLDLRPATDDRPFFYQFDKRVPGSVITVLSIAFIFVLMSLFVGRRQRNFKLRKAEQSFNLIFFVTGTAFMLFEVAIIQKLILYLGQPVLSLTVVLTFLMAGLAGGSILSSYIFRKPSWSIVTWSLAATGVLTLIYGLVGFRVPAALIGSSYALRVAVTALIIFLFGIIAGVPFPTAMSLLKGAKLQHEVPRMWSLNAAASVLGSALAVAVGTKAGFTYAVVAASALYSGGAVMSVILPNKS